jgi:hypothetical protein
VEMMFFLEPNKGSFKKHYCNKKRVTAVGLCYVDDASNKKNKFKKRLG